MLAVSAGDGDSAVVRDAHSGIFAHRIALADFNPGDLDYFRRLAQRVRVERRPNVETAIAIAGSSAQGKVQVFPGDADFFERVNIKAPDLAGARADRWASFCGRPRCGHWSSPISCWWRSTMGSTPTPDCIAARRTRPANSYRWTPDEVLYGEIEVIGADGQPRSLKWGDVTGGLGSSYLGWIVAEPSAGRIALASNMLDVTWKRPTEASRRSMARSMPGSRKFTWSRGIPSRCSPRLPAMWIPTPARPTPAACGRRCITTRTLTRATVRRPSACTTCFVSPTSSRPPPTCANYLTSQGPACTRPMGCWRPRGWQWPPAWASIAPPSRGKSIECLRTWPPLGWTRRG